MSSRRHLCIEVVAVVVLCAFMSTCISGQAPTLSPMMADMLADWFNLTKYGPFVMSTLERNYLIRLLLPPDVSNPNPTGPICHTRKEVRLMSEAEWKNFTDALLCVYDKKIDTASGKTVYQLFVGNHRFAQAPAAHNCPGFGAWHAIFLIAFEKALQECNPTVCIPFIDWRPEYAMHDHCESPIYTPQYFGNNKGPVVTGFNKGFTVTPEDCGGTPAGTPLERACQPLANNPDIFSYVNYNSYDALYNAYRDYPDICMPWNISYESWHGALHSDKGGHISIVSCSVNDPLFWCIHAFVDFFWNSKLRGKFSDTTQQIGHYPKAPQYSGIAANQTYDSKAYPFTGWTLEDGLKVAYLYGIQYLGLPDSCTKDEDCNYTPDNPKAFFCKESINRCVTKSREGGNCQEDNQCFRQDCTTEPICVGATGSSPGICICDYISYLLGHILG